MNRNLTIGIIIVLVVVGAGWFLLKDQIMPASTEMEMSTEENMAMPSDAMMTMDASPMGAMESTGSSTMESGEEIVVTGSNFKFDKTEIRVKAGDTVKIKFVNSQGFHDFVIDEFNVATKQTNGPSEEVAEFIADKPGTYEFYCSVGQHRAMGMKGSLIVE